MPIAPPGKDAQICAAQLEFDREHPMASTISNVSTTELQSQANPGLKPRTGEETRETGGADPDDAGRGPVGDKVAVSDKSVARSARREGPPPEQRIQHLDQAIAAAKAAQAHVTARPEQALMLQAQGLPSEIGSLLA